MASVQDQINSEIKAAEQAGWMANGMPVTVVDGQLKYDVDKIGQMWGIPQSVIEQIKSVKVPNIDAKRPQGRSEWETSGAGDDYMRQKSNRMRVQESLNKLGGEATALHNLYNMDAGVPVDFSNDVVRTNLAKPGFMSGLRGPGGRFDLADRITQEKKDSWADFIGTKILPAAVFATIGAGALSQFGAFGAGSTLTGGGAMPAGGAGLNALDPAVFSAGSGVNVGTAGGLSAASGSVAGGIDTAVNAGLSGGAAGGGVVSGGVAPSTGGFLGAAGDWAKRNWPGIALGGGAVLSDYLAAESAADRAEDYNEDLMNFLSQQQEIEYARQLERQKAAQDWYERISLPDPEAVAAAKRTGMNTLSNARENTYGSMFNQLAARGFGSGSGLGYGAAQGIEGDYLKSLGTLQDQMTQFGLTRQFAPAGQTYGFSPPNTRTVAQQSVPSGWESSLGSMSNILGTATGMYAANQLLGKNNKFTTNWG